MGEQNYVLGRGKLFFERFADNVTVSKGAFRYIGSTSQVTMTAANETLDHFSTEGGLRVKDRSVLLQQDLGGSFVTTNIDDDNVALLLLGTAGADTLGALSGQSETFQDVVLGTYQQIGVTEAKPEGIGNINVLTAVAGADTLVAGTDYTIDQKTGMLYWMEGADNLTDGDDVTITYSTTAGKRSRIINAGLEIFGALKYVADNQHGTDRDKVWPYIKLMPSGDFQLKGSEDWQQITFQFEVLRRADGVARAISTGRYV